MADVPALLSQLRASVDALDAALTPPVVAKPRLTPDRLTVSRTFRLPRGAMNGQTFEFGGGPLALDAHAQTLFVASRSGIAEVTIPADATPLPFATFVQGFADPSEGAILDTFGEHHADGSITPLAGLTGLVVLEDGRLLGNALVYYDALSAQRVSHFTRPRDLSVKGQVTPFVSVGNPTMTGYTAGYMTPIPPAWQAALKGTHLTGTFGSPIVTRGSLGPAAFAFTPETGPMGATSLVYYPNDHPTLGTYDVGPANPAYNMAAKADGLVIVDDSALFLGRSGIGPQCYGAGTGDPALVGTIESGSDPYVFDPTNGSKGTHAYPYRYQIWAYDLNDFAKVAAGTVKPWEILPYGVWPLDLPQQDVTFTGLGGAAFDPATRQLYVSQLRADQDGYAYRAYIHVLKVS